MLGHITKAYSTLKYQNYPNNANAEYGEIVGYQQSSLARKFVYGPGIDEPICMIVVDGEETKYYYHFDGLGLSISNEIKIRN